MANWSKIEHYDNYSVSDEGNVRNDNNGRLMTLRENQYLNVYVGLSKHAIQRTFSVAKLVAKAFVDGETETFDTPIHVDGRTRNNHASNLMWRPMWFARAYQRQFNYGSHYYIDRYLLNKNTGEIFNNSTEVVLAYGVLEKDIVLSLANRTYVWPTYHFFEVIQE